MVKKTEQNVAGLSVLDKLNKLKKKFSCEDKTEFYHSGSIVFDSVLSEGKGIPKGYMIEVAAPYGVGKTTLFLSIANFLCSQGKRIIYIDTEEGLNDTMMKSFGLDEYSDEGYFYRMQCATFKEVEEILDDTFVENSPIDMVMIDSVTNIIPSNLKDKSVEEFATPAYQARPLDLFLKKYRTISRNTGITLMFINQFRSAISFVGSSQKAAGGNALKHCMDIRVEMKKRLKGADIMRKTPANPKGEKIGSACTIYSTKNRFAKPYSEKTIYILFGKGVSNVETIIEWLRDKNYMNAGQGGRFMLKLPILDDIVNFKSQKERHEWVKENYEMLDDFIMKNGGYFAGENAENDEDDVVEMTEDQSLESETED